MPRATTRRLALLAGALTLGLALGEASVRVLGVDVPRVDLGVVPHPRWHHWHRADHTLDFRVAAEGYSVPVRFNGHGMRDSRTISRARAPGTLRVAVVGDSFVEAMQVAEDEGVTRRLQTHLAAELGRPVEVLNFGCSGFSTTLEAVLLREFVLSFAPDVVVCLHHFSDVTEDWTFSRYAERREGRVVAVKARTGEADSAVSRALHASQLYRVARSSTRRASPADPAASCQQTFDAVVHEPYTADDNEAWDYSLAALADMAGELRPRQIPFLVVVIPINSQVEPVTPEYAAQLGYAYLAGGKRLERHGYQRKVIGFCGDHGIDCLDLLPAFRAENLDGTPRLYLPRDLHWSAAGHDLAARHIADKLRAYARRSTPESTR